MHDGSTCNGHCEMMPPLNRCPKDRSVRRQVMSVHRSKIDYSDDVECDVLDNLDTMPMLALDTVNLIHALTNKSTDVALTLPYFFRFQTILNLILH